MSEQLYEVVHWPDVSGPVMIVALDGWIDAGYGAAGAIAHLTQEIDTQVVASFDTEELVDHRSRRPIMHVVDGVNTGLTWPLIELRHGVDTDGNDVLVLIGAEPDLRWRAFTRDVVGLAVDLGATMVVNLGAYPAPVPHTRPSRLATSASSPELANLVDQVYGTADVPSGIHAAVERGCVDQDLPAIGLWAQVPHYAAGMAFPGASAVLLEGLNRVGQIRVDTRALAEADGLLRTRLDSLIADNPEHAAMVRQLEQHYDESQPLGQVPSGDELAAEVERYLRELGR